MRNEEDFSPTKFGLPLVKSIWPSLASQQLVSVQPMKLPSGIIFYMDYTYEKNYWYLNDTVLESKNSNFCMGFLCCLYVYQKIRLNISTFSYASYRQYFYHVVFSKEK